MLTCHLLKGLFALFKEMSFNLRAKRKRKITDEK